MSAPKKNLVRIGSRKSPLAMAQSEWVASLIQKNGLGSPKIVGIITDGDRVGNPKKPDPSVAFGGKGLFVKALDEALLKNAIDIAVHSAKDVPANIPDGLSIAAIPVREDVADIMVSRSGWTLDTMPAGARVGTSSLRRAAQLRFIRPDCEIVPIRGNVDTRLAKIGKVCDAAVLAAAGVNRLGGCGKVLGKMKLKASRLDPAEFLPAPAQAAVMVISRNEDAEIYSVLSDETTVLAVEFERELVAFLGADCNWPLGALASVDSAGTWSVDAAIYSIEGKLRVRDRARGLSAKEQVRELADRLLVKGGKKILDWNRRRPGPSSPVFS